MSRETLQWLNDNTLIGYGVRPWHRVDAMQDERDNVYAGAIPVSEVIERLFSWKAAERRVAVEVPADMDTMTHLSDDGKPMRWEVQATRKAITRDDTEGVLGLFKSGYQPHGYAEWLIGAVSNIIGDTVGIGSAGLLKGGAVAWVGVEVPDSVSTKHGVEFVPRLLAGTSLDGTVATFFKRVNTLVVCDNTMEIARSESGFAYKIKHTRNSGFKLADARAALDIINASADEFTDQVNVLCETTVTDRQWSAFLDSYVPVTEADGKPKSGRGLTLAQNKRDDLVRLWNHDARVAPWARTAFGVLQATNTYGQHIASVRGAERAERNLLGAISGDIAKDDDATLSMLGKILANV